MRFVVIVSDTFRFDHVAAHGLRKVRTPALDWLAAHGADFQRAYTGSFPTAPNRADLYAGNYWFARSDWGPLPADVPTLADRLSRSGYVTQWIGDNPHLLKAGYCRGFTAAMQVRGQEGDAFFTRMNEPDPHVQPVAKTRYKPDPLGMTLVNFHEWINHPRTEADRFAPRTAEMACRWLEENYRHDQWMLWIEFFDCHEPWDAPEYFWRRYDPDYQGPEMRHPNYGPASAYTPAELRNLQAHYAGEVDLLDKSVGRILRQIEDCGIEDDTAIVFTTDHGIGLGEHNRTGKSNIHPTDDRCWLMLEELAHIPLIVYLPGMKPRKVRQFVQPVDTHATLLDLAGVGAEGELHGRSAKGLIAGRADRWGRDWAISSAHLGRCGPGSSGLPMLYTGKWAYGPRTERFGTAGLLFDMAADPGQTKNLARAHPAVAGRLRAKLRRQLAEIGVPEGQTAALMGE